MATKLDLSNVAVINIDVQRAFGKEAHSAALRGLRPSEDAEVEAAAALSEAVYDAGGTVIVTKDWHNAPGTTLSDGRIDNRAEQEFAIYGPHAEAGTQDAELNAPLEKTVQRLEKKEGIGRTVVPVDQYDRTGRAGSSRVIEVHKNVYDVTKRMDLDGVMRPHQSFIDVLARQQARGIKTAFVTGKIAEVCVKAFVESVRVPFPDLEIALVDGAVSSMPTDVAHSLALPSKEEVLEAAKAQGVKVI